MKEERRNLGMKNIMAAIIAKKAKHTAVKSANSVCSLYFYQPKELKKLRKF